MGSFQGSCASEGGHKKFIHAFFFSVFEVLFVINSSTETRRQSSKGSSPDQLLRQQLGLSFTHLLEKVLPGLSGFTAGTGASTSHLCRVTKVNLQYFQNSCCVANPINFTLASDQALLLFFQLD